jgi:hypothetical protein
MERHPPLLLPDRCGHQEHLSASKPRCHMSHEIKPGGLVETLWRFPNMGLRLRFF